MKKIHPLFAACFMAVCLFLSVVGVAAQAGTWSAPSKDGQDFFGFNFPIVPNPAYAPDYAQPTGGACTTGAIWQYHVKVSPPFPNKKAALYYHQDCN